MYARKFLDNIFNFLLIYHNRCLKLIRQPLFFRPNGKKKLDSYGTLWKFLNLPYFDDVPSEPTIGSSIYSVPLYVLAIFEEQPTLWLWYYQ